MWDGTNTWISSAFAAYRTQQQKHIRCQSRLPDSCRICYMDTLS